MSHSHLACRGDPSDEFRFATFFPEALHPVVDAVASVCSKIFRLGLQQSSAQATTSSRPVANGAPLPGSDATEAARRRYNFLRQAACIANTHVDMTHESVKKP